MCVERTSFFQQDALKDAMESVSSGAKEGTGVTRNFANRFTVTRRQKRGAGCNIPGCDGALSSCMSSRSLGELGLGLRCRFPCGRLAELDGDFGT
jgi:hypothetical protein